MGKLIVQEFMTLDGVAQAPGGGADDLDAGFAHGGWQTPYLHPESGAARFAEAESMDALLLGRKTYDFFSSYWPTAPAEMPFTPVMNNVRKYVASTTLSGPLGWSNAELLDGPIEASVAALTERHEEVHVIGSLDLLQTLLTAGLVDRLSLWVFPLVLGSGRRVFGDGTVPASLRLTESASFSTGAVHLAYERAEALGTSAS